MKMLMEISNLSHSFGEKAVLKELSFSIEAGKIIGLLGPSGAGKTTLVNVLTGQIKPTAGEIRLLGGDDESGRKKDSSDGFLTAGIMMDSFGLYERLSVWENLKIFAKIYGVSKERIDLLLKRTGLLKAKKTPVSKLSKGMRSRVNFCRALLPDSRILFLDEPTSGLDPATTEKLHALILEERDRGTTVFLTTHNMQEAEQLCDTIILLHEGRFVEYGTPGEICKKYCFEHKVEVVLQDGETHMLPIAAESVPPLADWMEKGAVFSLHSKEPDLEEVFLYLTGRRLNV